MNKTSVANYQPAYKCIGTLPLTVLSHCLSQSPLISSIHTHDLSLSFSLSLCRERRARGRRAQRELRTAPPCTFSGARGARGLEERPGAGVARPEQHRCRAGAPPEHHDDGGARTRSQSRRAGLPHAPGAARP
jgi:hypothetical protein